MAGKIVASQLINVDSKKGKKFIRNVERLRDEVFGMESKNANETTRLYKSLNQEQIENNPFLSTFLNWTKNTKDKELINMLDSLHLKSVSIGSFGRKAGYNHYPIAEPYFRFILHLGSPEAYYIDSRKPVAMLNGYGFFISPSHSSETSFTIYNEPIRLIHDPTVQSLVPKIRPKDYKRTILIYDYEFIPKDDVPEVVPEVVEEVVPEVVPQVVEEVVPEVVEEVVPEVVEEVIPQVVENTQVVEPPMTQAEKEAACYIC
jgi:hypothetical protein